MDLNNQKITSSTLPSTEFPLPGAVSRAGMAIPWHMIERICQKDQGPDYQKYLQACISLFTL